MSVLCIGDSGPVANARICPRVMLTIILPDGTQKQFDRPVTPQDIAAEIGPGLAQAALAAQVDGQVVGLDYRAPLGGFRCDCGC